MTGTDQAHRSIDTRQVGGKSPMASKYAARADTAIMYITRHSRHSRHNRTDTATIPNSTDSASDHRRHRRQTGVDAMRRPPALTRVPGGEIDGE